jgi:hypothetical protein
MALKLRRQAEMFTNRILSHRKSGVISDLLGTGADSFKRVLGGTIVAILLLTGIVAPNKRCIAQRGAFVGASGFAHEKPEKSRETNP